MGHYSTVTQNGGNTHDVDMMKRKHKNVKATRPGIFGESADGRGV
jgi:hypothetical protein